MFGFFCIAFIEYMVTGKHLVDYTNSFSPSNLKTNMKNVEYRFKKVNVTKKYLLGEIKYNHLIGISEKHKKTCEYLNFVEHLLIQVLAMTGYVSNSAFISSVAIPLGISSSRLGLSICPITAGIKQHKSIIKKRRRMVKQC